MKTRLNKFLSECGIGSRRKVEKFIKEGRIEVNNKIAMGFSIMVDSETDVVKFDGEVLRREKKVYYLLYKPKGFITSLKDEKNRKLVAELVKTNHRIFPVGRLDYNTTGVLILTNDGEFSNYFLHPSNRIVREYVVSLDKPLEEKDRNKLISGIFLDGKKSIFLDLKYLKKNQRIIKATTNEGRNHFVKRMFQQLEYKVVDLERIRFGPFDLRGLKIGEYRIILETEIRKIANM